MIILLWLLHGGVEEIKEALEVERIYWFYDCQSGIQGGLIISNSKNFQIPFFRKDGIVDSLSRFLWYFLFKTVNYYQKKT